MMTVTSAVSILYVHIIIFSCIQSILRDNSEVLQYLLIYIYLYYLMIIVHINHCDMIAA